MPQRGSASQQRAVPLKSNVEIVQQGFDRADVEDAESGPALRQHPRDHREERRFRLSARRWSQHDEMPATENRGDDRFLKWPQLTPTQAVDDVML